MKQAKKRVLILWNQHETDIYETFQAEGPQPLEWDPSRTASEVDTVREEMDAFINALKEGPYEVYCVNVKDDFERLLAAMRLHQPDVVFNLVEYFYENEALEAAVTGLYELYDVVYTGNEGHTLSTCARKVLTKVLLDDAGIPTASYFVVEDKNIPDPIELEMEYPLIVKPALEDASGGIETASVVRDYESLVARCEYILTEFEQPALVEAYIDGREIHAAILGNRENAKVLPLFEMEFDDSEFNPEGEWSPQIISYSAKWDPHSKSFYTMDAVCPPVGLGDELEEQIRQVALSAYRLLGCRDYARVDMRIGEDGTPYVLEVNPNPDLSDGGAYIMCATAAGYTYAQILQAIVECALGRRYIPPAAGEAPALASTDTMERRYRQKDKRKCVHCGSPLERASTSDSVDLPIPTPTPADVNQEADDEEEEEDEN